MEREYQIVENSRYEASFQEIPLAEHVVPTEDTESDRESEQTNLVLSPNEDGSGDTRRVIRANVVDNADQSVRRVKFTLAAQRRHKRAEPWRDVFEFPLTRLHGGEEARISLDAAETYDLFLALQDLYIISRAGEPSGQKRAYIVRRGDEPAPVSVEEIRRFFANGGASAWEQIVGLGEDIPLAAALHRVHSARQQAVYEFEQHIEAYDWDELRWQQFFSKNAWIFGHGLAYRFLQIEQDQAHYGGTVVRGDGEQKGDYLLSTRADVKFTVLVEIKKPDSPLLRPKLFRNGALSVSGELAGGVAQVQANCRTWAIEGSRTDGNRSWLEPEGIHTYEPKGILIIGNSAELNRVDRDQPAIHKRSSFEMFRRNLHNPEIITFDELLERARYMVAHEAGEQAAIRNKSDDG